MTARTEQDVKTLMRAIIRAHIGREGISVEELSATTGLSKRRVKALQSGDAISGHALLIVMGEHPELANRLLNIVGMGGVHTLSDEEVTEDEAEFALITAAQAISEGRLSKFAHNIRPKMDAAYRRAHRVLSALVHREARRQTA